MISLDILHSWASVPKRRRRLEIPGKGEENLEDPRERRIGSRLRQTEETKRKSSRRGGLQEVTTQRSFIQ